MKNGKETTVPTVSQKLASYDSNVVKGIRACIEGNENILLIGETGTGKTTLLNELMKEIEQELVRVSLNGATSTDDILGKMLAKDGSTYWQNGILIDAMITGKAIVFDEINAALPEVLFVLHSLLDDDRKVTLVEKNGEVIRPHKDFKFFACMNPSEDYAGTKETNMALMSRFGGVFYIEVFSQEEEIKILESHSIDNITATTLVSVACHLRDKRKNGDVHTFISTRDIIQGGKLATSLKDINLAIQYSVFNKMSKEEREDIKSDSTLKKYLSGEVYKSKEVIKLEKDVTELLKESQRKSDMEAELRKEIVRLEEIIKASLKAVTTTGGSLDTQTAELLRVLGVKGV